MTNSETEHAPEDLTSQLATELDALLRGLPIGAHVTVPPSADICYSLELFLPRVLRRHHPEWEKESLDGISVIRATKRGPAGVELVGTCILISDQTTMPFVADLEVTRTANSSSVIAVRLLLGEPGTGALGISGPPCNSRDAQRLMMSLVDRIDDVAWSYTIETGSEPR